MSETRFQNTKTALKNQQASIQGPETQIGQLSKLISERPQGSLPSNTEPNPREQLNVINTQDDEGVIEPEPEPRQETVVSQGRDKVDPNTNKPVTVEYKPRVPYANATRKDYLDEHFGDLTLRVGDETITLQARNFGITSNIEGNSPHRYTKTDNMTLQKLSFKEVHEPCSRNDKGHIHEERRLQIEELDECRAHKPRAHDKLKLCQNKADTSPNQLKVGDKVLLDVADPHIVTTTPNEEISLTVLSIFPFSTVEVSHPNFSAHTARHTGVPKAMAKEGKKHGHVIRPYRSRVNTGMGMEKHGRAKGKARFCFFDTGVRHARADKPWTTILLLYPLPRPLEEEEGSVIFCGSTSHREPSSDEDV
ncbi:hypothetical protein GOBAR_AA25812 [Gossypium barbadense]|uniref:Uncharacterized protein n=1 Tax=Gossypium barbadense TaxID=3634 RepID=A0A2P5WUV7_GOSBA|nr:hypothetical protein GOBAR_AA25812 [Gossypium barbadense]